MFKIFFIALELNLLNCTNVIFKCLSIRSFWAIIKENRLTNAFPPIGSVFSLILAYLGLFLSLGLNVLNGANAIFICLSIRLLRAIRKQNRLTNTFPLIASPFYVILAHFALVSSSRVKCAKMGQCYFHVVVNLVILSYRKAKSVEKLVSFHWERILAYSSTFGAFYRSRVKCAKLC